MVNAVLGGVVVVISLTRLSRSASHSHSALSGRDRIWRRSPLFHHVELGGGKFLDRARPGTGLRLFQFPQHRPLSRRDFSAPLPIDLWLDYSGRNCRQYSSASLDQVARAAAAIDAANDCGVTDHFLVVTRFLAICPSALFQRKFLD